MTGRNADRIVLVTGASKGIGLATVRLLAARGFTVYAGVRDRADLPRVEAEGNGAVRGLVLEVTDEPSRRQAVARVAREGGEAGLYGLVNNAGIAIAAPLEFVPLEELRRQFEVNLFGLLAVTQACLPLLRRHRAAAAADPSSRSAAWRRPRIVNVSSIGGRIAFSPSGPYTASKFALEALTDTLRMEVEPQGLRVAAVEPGTVSTPLWDKALAAGTQIQDSLPAEALELYGERVAGAVSHARSAADRGVSPERVAAVILRALSTRRPRTRYLVGPDARLAARLVQPLPDRLRDRLLEMRDRFSGTERS